MIDVTNPEPSDVIGNSRPTTAVAFQSIGAVQLSAPVSLSRVPRKITMPLRIQFALGSMEAGGRLEAAQTRNVQGPKGRNSRCLG